MTVKIVIEKIESNEIFLEWKRGNKDSYLCYGFTTLEENRISEWQIGYYNKKTDKITTFSFKDNKVVIQPEEDIFKKPGAKILKLDIKNVEVFLQEAMDKAGDFIKEKFPKEEINKIIITLQNIEELDEIWNLIYITKRMNIVNIKMSCSDGKILKHSVSNAFEFKKK